MIKQAMSELALDLERGGHVVRAPDPADRRVTTVTITGRERHTVRVVMEAKGEVEAEYAAIVGQPRLTALHETLMMLIGALG